MDDNFEKITVALLNMVEQELDVEKARIMTSIKKKIYRFKEGNRSSGLKLVFRQKIPDTILTGEIIEGEGKTRIEVALIDDTTGQVVHFGPEASARVEILVLNGDFDRSEADGWTSEDFNENIVPDIKRKMPFLAGIVLIKLQRGICSLENIKFRHHTSKVKPPFFRLGARIVQISDEVCVKEAKTNSFTVRNFRNKYIKKHEIPNLSDDVWRLTNIGKGGNIGKRLQDDGISTVEDFLIRLLLDPHGLKNIVNLGEMKWAVTVKHARACPSGKRIYCFKNSEQKACVVFNIRGQILGIYSGGLYAPTNSLSIENHKADLHGVLSSVPEPWAKIIPFEDEESLEQYFTTLNFEMIGESNNAANRNSASTSISSAANVGDFCFVDTEDEEAMYSATHSQFRPQSPYDPYTFFPDF